MPRTLIPLNVCCLADGSGTTVEAILLAIAQHRLPNVKIGLVISANPNAGVIYKAVAGGVAQNDVLVVSPKDYPTEDAQGEAILRACKDRDINFISQCGRIAYTPATVVKEFHGRIVNQHPGTIAFSLNATDRLDFGGEGMYGRRVIAAARHFAHLTNTRWYTYATCHFVKEGYDTGQVIRAWAVPFGRNDSVLEIQQRLLPVEHEVQIATLGDAGSGSLGRKELRDPVSPNLKKELYRARELAITEYPNG